MDPQDQKYGVVDNLIKKGEQKLRDHCIDICSDHNEILKFAYELRRQDCELNWVNKAQGEASDRFTKAFLEDYL